MLVEAAVPVAPVELVETALVGAVGPALAVRGGKVMVPVDTEVSVGAVVGVDAAN